MAEITKPAALKFASVTARYTKAKSRNESPFTFASQTYVWAGSKWRFMFKLPPLRGSDALGVVEFLRDLAAGNDYFVCDVSRYTPSDVGTVVGAARNLNLRLVGNEVSWDVGRAITFGITFEAEEDQ